MKIVFVFLFLVLPLFAAFGQDSTQAAHTAVARAFIEAYNRQQYPVMFSIFPDQIKSIDDKRKKEIEKDLRTNYRAQFKESGKARIDTIIFQSKNQLTLKLHYEKDGDEITYMIMSFDQTGIMQGLGTRDPDFNYPLTPGTSSMTDSWRSHKIDSLVKLKFRKDKFNGSVAVMDNGKTIYEKCYGYSDLQKKIPLNDNSLFELASCTKQFTAMAIMMLAERGKLNYSDTLQRFIPDLPYYGITIENLLTHTSGLPDYMEEMESHWDKTKFATNYDIIELFKKNRPDSLFAPNEKYTYSNTGYAMLSVIIEKASGMTYAEFLKKNIFEPLGMKRSRVYNTRRSLHETIDNYAYGYVYSDSLKKYLLPDEVPELEMVKYLDAITGDGSVNSTLPDLLLWDKALRENKLVTKATLDRAYSKHILSNGKESRYGYGEFIQSTPGSEKLVYHSGGWPGYCTFILHFVDRNSAIIILTNDEYGEISKLANKIGLVLMKH